MPQQPIAAPHIFFNYNPISKNRSHSCKKSLRLLVTCASSSPNFTVNSISLSFFGVQSTSIPKTIVITLMPVCRGISQMLLHLLI